MKETSSWQFGLVIAYLLPGFIGLAGISSFLPAVAAWLWPVNQSLSIGPTVYAILAAITVGMTLSCVRWLLIDHLHHWTGVVRPDWDDSRLDERLGPFNFLVEAHYRYYQFYANMIVAVLFSYGLARFLKTSPFLGFGTDLGVAILCIVLFVGSRDALSNYYAGTTRLVGQVAEKDRTGNDMTNGRGHDSVGCATSSKPAPAPKENEKPPSPQKPDQAAAAATPAGQK